MLIANLTSRFLTAAASIAASILVGFLYGNGVLGVYLFYFSLITVGGMVCRGGMETSIVKYAGRQFQSSMKGVYLKGALLVSIMHFLVFSIIFSLLYLGLKRYVEDYVSNGYAVFVMIGVLCQIVCLLMSAYMKSIDRSHIAVLLEAGGAEIYFIIISTFYYFLFYESASDMKMGVVKMFLMGNIINFLFSVLLFFIFVEKKRVKIRRLLEVGFLLEKRSLNFLQNNILTQASGRSFPFFLGWIYSPAVVGAYGLIQSISMGVSFILIVYSAFLPKKITYLYRRREIKELKSEYNKARTQMLILAVICAFLILIPAQWLYQSINAVAVLDNILVLTVAVIAQIYNVYVGPAALVLNMIGQDRYVKNNTGLSSALLFGVTFIIWFFSSPDYSILKVVSVYASVLVIKNYFLWKKVRRVFKDQFGAVI